MLASGNLGKLSPVERSFELIYHKRPHAPEFSINITNRCPNACPFCVRDRQMGWNVDAHDRPVNLYLERDPTVEEVARAVRAQLAESGERTKLIKFCGYGEPTVRLDVIVAIASMIRETHPDPELCIQVDTTGWPLLVLHGHEGVARLVRAGVDALSVSLNAPTLALYRRLTRPEIPAERAFDLSQRAVRLAVQAGMLVKVTAVAIGPLERDPTVRQAFRNLAFRLGAVPILRPYTNDAALAKGTR